MVEIFQYLLNGLTIGGIYALVALGFYMMWEVSKAANFTHGDIYMVGAVTAVMLVGQGVPAAARQPRLRSWSPPRWAR